MSAASPRVSSLTHPDPRGFDFAFELARARKDALALRGPYTPVEVRRRPALTVECGCPSCGGRLSMLSKAVPAVRATSAVLECVDCASAVHVNVTMRSCDGRRYDVAALVEHLGGDDVDAARVLGIHRHTLARYRRHGVSDVVADRLAVQVGLHPSAIWPQWWPEEASA